MTKTKNQIKDNFLTDLNDPKNIYLWGLFWADACLSKNYFSYECIEDDFIELEQLFIDFGITSFSSRQRRIDNINFGKRVRKFSFSNKLLNITLNKFNFQNKSCTFNNDLLSLISKSNIHHFWRGFFDGDGFLGLYFRKRRKGKIINNKRAEAQFSFCAKENFIWYELCKYLEIIGIKNFKIKKCKTGESFCSYLYIGKKDDIKLMLDTLYNNSNNLFLTRKYLKYLKFLDNF